jgi:Asp/Glu/hydantoin racemase
MARILVINPNSSAAVTQVMNESLNVLRFAGGPEVISQYLQDAPIGIESQRDIDSVVLPLSRKIAAQPADAYVVACFSDPGLALARETTSSPVLGVAESAYFTAIGLGRRFGVIAIGERSIPRHLRYIRSLGLQDWLAGDISIHSDVAGLADFEHSIERIVVVGRQLRDEKCADVLILGCVGMSPYRAELERQTGLPVIDPTQAAVARAISYIALGCKPGL